MTYKKALNDLKRQVEHFENGTEFSYSLPPLKVAVKALEKQIPKKPNDIKRVGGSVIEIGKCPKCNDNVNNTQHYCDICGQALDWEVYNGSIL